MLHSAGAACMILCMEATTATTYCVKIGFRNKPTWEKGGYTLEQALEVKTYFLERVPSAIWGSCAPEGEE